MDSTLPYLPQLLSSPTSGVLVMDSARRSGRHARSPALRASSTSGSTPRASIKPAAPSCLKLSTRCTSGTAWLMSAMPSYRTYLMTTTSTRQTLHSAAVDGSGGDGRSRNLSHQRGSSSSRGDGLSSARRSRYSRSFRMSRKSTAVSCCTPSRSMRPASRRALMASTELVLGPMVQMMEERRYV